MAPDDKSIFIDEDWKAQVQREKEEAQKKAEESVPAAEEGQPEDGMNQGEANFSGLVDSMAAQALYALGVLAQEGSQQIYVDLLQAKFMIDMLGVLKEKTKGNLLPEEEGALNENIAELQRIFVIRSQQIQEAQLRQAGVDFSSLKQQ
jgi:hypothetical protein